MIVREHVETIAYAVQMPCFLQDRIQGHGVRTFPESLRRENFRWADLVQGT